MLNKMKGWVLGAAASVAGFFGTAQAAVVDPLVMDAHVADLTTDITALAGYGIGIILLIMAVTIVYSLLKRGK